MHRVLAVIYAVPGVGWAVATPAVLLYDRWGLAWLLIAASIAVSVADVRIGRWRWQGTRRGAILALVTAPIRALATVVAWRDLRR